MAAGIAPSLGLPVPSVAGLHVAAPLGHAFGERYDSPVPLALFVVGGAVVVLLSFLLVYRTTVGTVAAVPAGDGGGRAGTGAAPRAATRAATGGGVGTT